MTQLTPAGLLSLPDEVIQSILSYVPPQQIPSVQRVCRRFVNVAAEPLLWRDYCVSSFRWWHKGHQFNDKLREPSSTDWRRLYADRHRGSRNTQRALNRLLDTEIGRLDQLQQILAIGYDAKGVLLDSFHSAKQSDKYLAQRYWSHAALGCLHRMLAIEEWLSLKYGEEVSDATERSFAALDMFILEERSDGDVDGILSRLNSYVSSIRSANPEIDTRTPRQRATTIAEYVLEHKLTGIQDDRHYHSLDHLFLGVSLFSENHNSVPLISAIIYSYVARQFNLSAQPVSYPFHVHVLVQSPPGIDLDGNPYSPSTTPPDPNSPTTLLPPETSMYMDPFAQPNPIPLSHLQRQLTFIDPRSTTSQQLSYLTASTPRDLTIRAAQNILRAPQQYSGPPLFPISTHSATYAALFALVILPSAQHPAQLRQHLAVLAQHFLEHFDLDVHIFESYVLPLTTSLPDANAYRALMRNIRDADSAPRVPKRRHGENGEENENSCVKFFVGQVFRHRRRQYLAVIYGWDPYCRMQEEWIAMNQVDRLGRGRGQPFYNVLVDDESTRYVAEENVNLLLAGEMSEDEIVDSFPIEIGKWFKRFDIDAGEEREIGRFVSNVRAEYPDD